MKKKPCSVCGVWVRPHPRLGARQRTCGAEGCRREQHRRSCAAHRAATRGATQERRLRARLVDAEGKPRRDVLRDLMPTEVAVSIDEFARVLVPGTRAGERFEQLVVRAAGALPAVLGDLLA